jgi:putative inorganic carbon (HCO3(-)) transporter
MGQMNRLYTLNPKTLWEQLKREHLAFWAVCLFFVVQYFDPQQIYPRLDFLPWDKIAVGLAVLALPSDPNRRWVKDSTNVWLTLFALVIIVASYLAIYPEVSWKYLFDFLNWYLLYFLIINIVTTPERYFLVLVIFLLANFKMAIFGARTWISRGFGFVNWGIEGPAGFFQNSADLSIEMLMFAPIAFELGMFVKPYVRRATRLFLLVGAAAGAMTILGASSRGAQLALAAQGVWIAIQRKLNIKILVLVAVVVAVGYRLLPAAEKARFATAGTDQTSQQRLDYWKAGLAMIRSHPYFGVGYFNFQPLYAQRDPTHLFYGKAQLPHNIFIQVGTDAGLIGLAIFVILIFRNLRLTVEISRTCARSNRTPTYGASVARGLALATIGFVIAGQFDTVAYYPFIWINLALSVSLANIVRKAAADEVPGTGTGGRQIIQNKMRRRVSNAISS